MRFCFNLYKNKEFRLVSRRLSRSFMLAVRELKFVRKINKLGGAKLWVKFTSYRLKYENVD